MSSYRCRNYFSNLCEGDFIQLTRRREGIGKGGKASEDFTPSGGVEVASGPIAFLQKSRSRCQECILFRLEVMEKESYHLRKSEGRIHD